MATFTQVARALVTAGYLSDADANTAASVLADALLIDETIAAGAAALDDAVYQEGVITEAEVYAEEDGSAGDWDAVDREEEIIDAATAQEAKDAAIIAAAKDTIVAACADAAAALATAELIDAGDVGAVSEVITGVWVVAEDSEKEGR
jgi:hypothetical protein